MRPCAKRIPSDERFPSFAPDLRLQCREVYLAEFVVARHSLWMLLSILLFTVSNLLVRYCENLTVMEILFYRSAMGLAAIFLVIRASKTPLATRHPFLHFMRCACGIAVMAGGFYLVQNLPFGTSQTLMYTNPIFFAVFIIIACLVSHKKIDWPVIASIPVGFAGIVIVLRPEFAAESMWITAVGVFTGIASAGCDWFLMGLGRAKEHANRTVFYFSLAGTAAGLAWVLAAGGFHALTGQTALALLGIGATALVGQVTMVWAWDGGNDLLNVIYQYASILFAVGFGIVLFSEVPDWLTVAGTAIVIATGIYASVRRIVAERKGDI